MLSRYNSFGFRTYFFNCFYLFLLFFLNLYKSKKSRTDTREKENKNNTKANKGLPATKHCFFRNLGFPA